MCKEQRVAWLTRKGECLAIRWDHSELRNREQVNRLLSWLFEFIEEHAVSIKAFVLGLFHAQRGIAVHVGSVQIRLCRDDQRSNKDHQSREKDHPSSEFTREFSGGLV